MGHSDSTRQCSLGTFTFLNAERETDKRGHTWAKQYVFTQMKPSERDIRLLNKAAQSVEGVIGVKHIDHTPGVTLAIVLDGDTDEEKIPAILKALFGVYDDLQASYVPTSREEVLANMAVNSQVPAHGHYGQN